MIVRHLAKLNTASRNGLFYALVTVMVIAVYNWVIEPRVTYLQAVERLAPVVGSVSKEKNNLEKQLTIRQTMVERLSRENAESRMLLYNPQQIIQIESDMRTLASLAGAEIVGIKEDEQVTSNRPQSYKQGLMSIELHQARVELCGPYHSLIKFMDSLQGEFKGLEVHKVQIEEGQNDSDHLRCSFVVVLHVVKDREVLINEQTLDN